MSDLTPEVVVESRPRCEGCGNEIDPDWCWCGSAIKDHGHAPGHGPIPMGCDCGRVKDGECD